jgi:Rad3-related DNA helicase
MHVDGMPVRQYTASRPSHILDGVPSGDHDLLAHFPVGATPRPDQARLRRALGDALWNAEADPAAPRLFAVEAPPGVGKSHIAMAVARWSGSAYLLTSQKLLQDQYELPYPDLGDPWTAARRQRDPRWYAVEAVKALVQAYGRACRHADDRGVTYVLDGQLESFLSHNRVLLPEWFLEAVVPALRAYRSMMDKDGESEAG